MSNLEQAIDRLAHWAAKSRFRLYITLAAIWGFTILVCGAVIGFVGWALLWPAVEKWLL